MEGSRGWCTKSPFYRRSLAEASLASSVACLLGEPPCALPESPITSAGIGGRQRYVVVFVRGSQTSPLVTEFLSIRHDIIRVSSTYLHASKELLTSISMSISPSTCPSIPATPLLGVAAVSLGATIMAWAKHPSFKLPAALRYTCAIITDRLLVECCFSSLPGSALFSYDAHFA